ncbi:MAG: helix-turn-helix transcriptional regulator [Oscillospiraceae bacterium]|nr:helix-turn-helix transcriptional regulator [Oscillospiraceae bacterium]
MSMDEKEQVISESLKDVDVVYTKFGSRLRQIRKEMGLTQDEFAKLLGTSKQILSRYEREDRSPRIEVVRKYAEALKVSADYLLGDDEAEAISSMFWTQKKEKPFYKIFIEVTANQMGLDIPGVVQKTGLTDKQVRTIITRQMKVAPLDLAMQLSDTLNVPLEVWLGIEDYTPAEVSTDAYEVARAYDQADIKSKNMVRMALDLELVKEGTD